MRCHSVTVALARWQYSLFGSSNPYSVAVILTLWQQSLLWQQFLFRGSSPYNLAVVIVRWQQSLLGGTSPCSVAVVLTLWQQSLLWQQFLFGGCSPGISCSVAVFLAVVHVRWQQSLQCDNSPCSVAVVLVRWQQSLLGGSCPCWVVVVYQIPPKSVSQCGKNGQECSYVSEVKNACRCADLSKHVVVRQPHAQNVSAKFD